ncbi:MAG: DNA mismatch repair protein MutS [Oscillospiraceae bacterium]|nr:DNA mismatch repair protein MutS [Oscillospiraceae bacterium]
MSAKNPVTPMMQQYLQVKEKYKDCLLFFRLGDFYEMFFDDAKIASKVLELTLTGRNCGQEEKAPMCGVPFHSVQTYIARLIKRGYKVAICEQMEDPALAKDIVKRDVVRVITPGTANLDLALSESTNNFLACIYTDDENFGICFSDVSTGDFFATYGKQDIAEGKMANVIACYKPTEIIANQSAIKFSKVFANLKKRCDFYLSYLPDENFELSSCEDRVNQKFGAFSDSAKLLSQNTYALCAAGGALKYLADTQKVDLSNISKANVYNSSSFVEIDLSSRRNLELTETMRDKSKKGSLLGILDKTCTSMGARLLRKWIEQPLLNSSEINMRLDAVEFFVKNIPVRSQAAEVLKGIGDIERIMSKVVYGSVNARELVALKNSFCNLQKIKDISQNFETEYLSEIARNLDSINDLYLLINSAFIDEPPVTIREGGMIKPGFDKELDAIKDTVKNGARIIAEIEAREREETGVKNLKISYNKVFGYYIEITKSNIDKAPDRYIRKQTLTNCERYITEELKDVENRILGANEKITALEYSDFCAVRDAVSKNMERILLQAKLIAVIDVLASFALVAEENGYIKPKVDDSDVIDIKNGRHPIVEKFLTDSLFVPNDTYLDTDKNRFSIITGPNMAGKSTYMRQTAIITVMAQIGSFVPASECRIGIVDKIFTRVGASDDLSAGQSTFMVEMTEVANIINNATEKSLLILDEIGRGTSTFDGLSIAWAVVEYLSDKKLIGAKSLFATHYHELIALEDEIDGVNNYSIAVKKHGDNITFLRKIVKGGTDDSFGIEVAHLAGVPKKVVERAKEILANIEKGDFNKEHKSVNYDMDKKSDEEMASKIIGIIKSYDISTLTPIEALNAIYKLQRIIDKKE